MKTQKSFFEQNGGTYTRVGDVLLPNLTIGEAEQRPIGKYGRMRKHHLKEQQGRGYPYPWVVSCHYSRWIRANQLLSRMLFSRTIHSTRAALRRRSSSSTAPLSSPFCKAST